MNQTMVQALRNLKPTQGKTTDRQIPVIKGNENKCLFRFIGGQVNSLLTRHLRPFPRLPSEAGQLKNALIKIYLTLFCSFPHLLYLLLLYCDWRGRERGNEYDELYIYRWMEWGRKGWFLIIKIQREQLQKYGWLKELEK